MKQYERVGLQEQATPFGSINIESKVESNTRYNSQQNLRPKVLNMNHQTIFPQKA